MNDFAPADVLSDLVSRLNKLGLRYAVGGSVASSVWGLPRFTNDIDVSVDLPEKALPSLVAEFSGDYMVNVAAFEEAIASTEGFRTAQLLHVKHAFKIDVFLVEQSDYGLLALDRAREIEVAVGLLARVHSPEDVVLAKLRWYELGGRASDRQWNDLVQVIATQGDAFDVEYLLGWASGFGVDELAREAIAEAGPIGA